MVICGFWADGATTLTTTVRYRTISGNSIPLPTNGFGRLETAPLAATPSPEPTAFWENLLLETSLVPYGRKQIWNDTSSNFGLFGGQGDDATGMEGILMTFGSSILPRAKWAWMGGSST